MHRYILVRSVLNDLCGIRSAVYGCSSRNERNCMLRNFKPTETTNVVTAPEDIPCENQLDSQNEMAHILDL